MVLEEHSMCPGCCGWVFCVIRRSVFQECLSLPIWLREGSELGTCVVAIFKTCSAAPVIEGDLLGSDGGVVRVLCCLLKIVLPLSSQTTDFSKSNGLQPLNSFLDVFAEKW